MDEGGREINGAIMGSALITSKIGVLSVLPGVRVVVKSALSVFCLLNETVKHKTSTSNSH